MRMTGIVRKIDNMGRVSVPCEIRRVLHIKEGDPLEIMLMDDGIMFKKYNAYVSVQKSLDSLKEVVIEEEKLDGKDEILQKISELDSLIRSDAR